MNRIILIGNGFDLAHGMKTSYKDFLNDYYITKFEEYQNSVSRSYGFECDEFSIHDSTRYINCFNFKDLERFGIRLLYKNKFLEELSDKLNLQNWVDIENDYYQHLLTFLNTKYKTYNGDTIDKLNEDLESIKKLLENHLLKVFKKFSINEAIQKYIDEQFYSEFHYDELSEDIKNKIFQQGWEYIQSVKSELMRTNLKNGKDWNRNILPASALDLITNSSLVKKEDFFKNLHEKSSLITDVIKGTVIVNFNYTTTEENYLRKSTKVIHIHGELKNENNPIIFGYGDEFDANYSLIENNGNDSFLDNMKSINYSQTGNYKKVLSAINEDSYQICIYGHSCGNSDRTLLKTIFEHDNCASIKIYYREYLDSAGVLKDNYLDIYKNVSRNFDDKVKLRDRVVNKTFCQPIVPVDIQKKAFSI